MSHAVHHADTRAVHTCAMAQHDDFDRQAWLDALNALVQRGLVEVVSIVEDGEPSYTLRRGFATCESSQLIPSPYPGPGQSLTRETIFHVRKQRTGDGGRSFREVYVPADFLGFDHADVRVASLAAVEAFYDALMPELGPGKILWIRRSGRKLACADRRASLQHGRVSRNARAGRTRTLHRVHRRPRDGGDGDAHRLPRRDGCRRRAIARAGAGTRRARDRGRRRFRRVSRRVLPRSRRHGARNLRATAEELARLFRRKFRRSSVTKLTASPSSLRVSTKHSEASGSCASMARKTSYGASTLDRQRRSSGVRGL